MKKPHSPYLRISIFGAIFLFVFTLSTPLTNAVGFKTPWPPQFPKISESLSQRICNHFGRLAPRRIPIPSPSFCNTDPEPEPEAPTADISADPLTVIEGATTTLSWISTDAETCTASGGWSGSKTLSGSEDVTLSTST